MTGTITTPGGIPSRRHDRGATATGAGGTTTTAGGGGTTTPRLASRRAGEPIALSGAIRTMAASVIAAHRRLSEDPWLT
jgi:hypothetical protein